MQGFAATPAVRRIHSGMSDGPAWRGRARAALDQYFEQRSFPRTMLSIVLIITGLCGFLVSYGLLPS
jgi:hypothetical protein